MPTTRKKQHFSKSIPDRRPAPARRLCLSGLGKPHLFPSGSPAERICPRCRGRLAEKLRSVSPTMLHPLPYCGDA